MHAAFVSPVLANSPITLHIPGKVIIDNRFVVTGFRSNFFVFLFDSLTKMRKCNWFGLSRIFHSSSQC